MTVVFWVRHKAATALPKAPLLWALGVCNDSDASKYLKRGKPRHICMLLHFITFLKVCDAVSLKFIIFTVLFFFPRLALTLGLRERERSWATFWLPWGKLLPRKTDLLIKTVQTQTCWAVLVLFWWWPLITILKFPYIYIRSHWKVKWIQRVKPCCGLFWSFWLTLNWNVLQKWICLQKNPVYKPSKAINIQFLEKHVIFVHKFKRSWEVHVFWPGPGTVVLNTMACFQSPDLFIPFRVRGRVLGPDPVAQAKAGPTLAEFITGLYASWVQYLAQGYLGIALTAFLHLPQCRSAVLNNAALEMLP